MNRYTRLAVGATILLAVVACGGDDDDTSEPAGTEPPATAAAADQGTTADTGGADQAAAADQATVQVADHPELGEYLVDADGRTLYLFERDQGTETACSGECAEAWPPLAADQPTAGDGVTQDELDTSENGIVANQVTYQGHLLYYFVTDVEPGQIEGTTLPGWYAVDPEGDAIQLDGGEPGGENQAVTTGGGGRSGY